MDALVHVSIMYIYAHQMNNIWLAS